MAAGQGESAADLLARLTEGELNRIFQEWGEEPRARRIANMIIKTRNKRPLTSTLELAELVRQASPRHSRIHPATRVFQGLRIAVNRELERLQTFLQLFPDLLTEGGRLAVISFHSLEDRLVKQNFRRLEKEGRIRALTRKPIRPVEREVRGNPRSRSARLRIAEKAEGG